MQPVYREFLQRAAAAAMHDGAFGGGRLRRLPLRVQRQEAFRTDAQAGLLAVPVSATAAQLRSHVEVLPLQILSFLSSFRIWQLVSQQQDFA